MKFEDFKTPKSSLDDEDSLETLESGLYSRGESVPGVPDHEARFKRHDVSVQRGWKNGLERSSDFHQSVSHMPILKKIFIASLVFFLAAVGAASYVFFGGGNVISSSNVEIFITGPVSIAGGEVLPLEIKVTNQNNADLVTSELVIDYPEGTREVEDTSVSLNRYREELGTIGKGESMTKKIQVALFGQEGDVKVLKISVEYRVRGSNAIVPKKKEYSVAISSSPVTLNIISVKEVNANQDVEFTIDAISNAPGVIKNLAVSAEYPFGFTFKNSDPAPSWSNSFWRLGDIKPGVKRVIKVRGTVAGQDNEDRTFRFLAGTESPTNDTVIGTSFLTAVHKISIKKPFIGTTLALNGDRSEVFVAKSGENIRADMVLTNNIGIKITDLKVSAKIGGTILNPTSVNSNGGFFRSSENTIFWDQTLDKKLAVLNPDDSISLGFSFSTFSEAEMRSIKNPQMSFTVEVKGLRLNESGVAQEVVSKISKTLRVPSNLGLSARALYYSGPFTNTGPIPPRVDVDTSYTIVWSLTNGSNDLSNVSVSASLPSYVKWLAVTSPSTEKISYAPVGGKIVWEAGDLKAGTGFATRPREVSFQVSLAPGISQLQTSPVLVTGANASGQDDFASQTVGAVGATLTTDLTTDVSFKQGQGAVVR